MVADIAPALAGSNMVRIDSISDTADKGSVGSWREDIAAQRPNSWINGSAAYPQLVSS